MINNLQANRSQINFNGGFLIDYTRAAKGTLEYIETKAINNHRNIFRNWQGNPNQVFYVTRNKKDYQAAIAIYNNALKAKYYPNINTKLRLDSECPEMLETCLANPEMATCISGPKRIFNYVEETRPHGRTIVNSHIKGTVIPELSIEDKIFKNLRVLFEANKNTYPNGITKFIDKSGEHNMVVISPKAKNRTFYAYTLYEKFPEDNRYYQLDENGDVIKRYEIKELREFTRDFDESVRRYKQMHETK